jgi:coenzyme F420-0:L-glutamate ligase/coenzyme F420-1:gamma-L-glutamate ligase
MESLETKGIEIQDNDILVIAQKIISKNERRIVNLNKITPSSSAIEISSIHLKDPRLIELILKESSQILKVSSKHLIVQTKHGFICANAGIDQSNVSYNKDEVLLLPIDPDKSAKKIREDIHRKTKKTISIIISDTHGRPFRNGQINIAIGTAGILPLRSYIGKKDTFGKSLKVTEIAIIDELASAAELVMGKDLNTPAALIRGYNYKIVGFDEDQKNLTNSIIREKSLDLFRSD